jgi:zinc D-Ala-D-Ala carboxypeptidase
MKRVVFIVLIMAIVFAVVSMKNRMIVSRDALSTVSDLETVAVSTPAVTPVIPPSVTPVITPEVTPSITPSAELMPDIRCDYDMQIPLIYQNLKYFNAELYDRYVLYKEGNPGMEYDMVILHVNIGLDKPFYSDINMIDKSDEVYVLVNKYNKLPDDFAPELEQIPSSLCVPGVGRQYLRKDAKEAFEKMHADAKELGLNITAYGTYRSIQTQHDIWNRKVNSGRSTEDVDKLNSRGGHSEHHTGLAIDVIGNNYSVENTEEFKWYRGNIHHYGFIIRYPQGKEDITGYGYEPWHLRYIGEELAAAVYESGLCYEEYYAMEIASEIK